MKIKELLKDPSAWTKDAYARDAHGFACDMKSLRASCFCLVGAVYRCYSEYNDRLVVFAKLREVAKQQTGIHIESVPRFNDDPRTTHADILAVVELADV